nr:ISKra4 family transposase [Pseudodesulfovibrio sp.]
MISFLESGEGNSMDMSQLEKELEERGRELMRTLIQEHLNNRSPGTSSEPVRDADGIHRTKAPDQERKIETVFGRVGLNRAGYAEKGCKSLHPLDAELNLSPEIYSLELQRRVAQEAAKNSFEEVVETITQTTGGHVAKRQAEEISQRAARDFDAFYENRQCKSSTDKNTGSILTITADGKGVVLHEKDLREKTRKAAEQRRQKMGKRLSKGEKKNCKRMATVAAVYTTTPFERTADDVLSKGGSRINKMKCPPIENKRVWASLEKTPEEVISDAFAEAENRDPDHEKTWVALVDGNNTQINILQKIANDKGIKLTIIVDVIHVIEYLWKAGRAFHPESGLELENWVQQRIWKILQGKAGHMAGGMRRSATRKKLSIEERKPVDQCATYLLNKSPYLRYDSYFADGFPIATGVIEGACRHLVKDRMEITGAKWGLRGAEAVLRLRALRSSKDFDAYWVFHEECEYKRNHQANYADGVVPSTTNLRTGVKNTALRVIK